METNSARERPKSAVEKAGAWKPAKTRSRFPPAPTLPWKSRQRREIPTFPPRRRRRLSSPRKRPRQKQRPNPKPRRRPNGRVALFHKADRSRIYKTGQLDLLTTPEDRGQFSQAVRFADEAVELRSGKPRGHAFFAVRAGQNHFQIGGEFPSLR